MNVTDVFSPLRTILFSTDLNLTFCSHSVNGGFEPLGQFNQSNAFTGHESLFTIEHHDIANASVIQTVINVEYKV